MDEQQQQRVHSQGEAVATTHPLNDIGKLVIQGTIHTAKKHYVLSSGWLIGLLICLFASGFIPNDEAVIKYEQQMSTLDYNLVYDAKVELREANNEYYYSKGWLSCNDICNRKYEKYQETLAKVNALEHDYAQGISDAKKELGLFSEHGTEETRNLFWSYFNWGKDIAKKRTMFEALFLGMTMGRNEGIFEFLLRMLLNLFINFTLSLISALIGFMFALWGLIRSYQPDLMSSLFFFICAALGATAFVATWILGLVFGTGSVIYGVASIAISNAQIQGRSRHYVQPGPHFQQQFRQQNAGFTERDDREHRD